MWRDSAGMMKFGVSIPSVAIAVLIVTVPLHAQNWPSFRGANATGVANGTPPIAWDATSRKNVAWKTAVAGLAHSSPIVWGDRVYVITTVASSGAPRIVTGDSSRAGIDPASDMVTHTWRLLAIDKRTGRVVWDRPVHSSGAVHMGILHFLERVVVTPTDVPHRP